MDEDEEARRLLSLPEAGSPRQYGCTHVHREPLPGIVPINKQYVRWERCTTCFMSRRVAAKGFGMPGIPY